MAVEARINPTWLYKWLIMAGVLFLFGVWCIYDGVVAYPEHNRQVAEFNEYRESGRLDEWPEYAASQGWDADDPGDAYSDLDLTMQWIQLGVVWSLGAVILIWVGFHYNRKLLADETHLQGANGRRIPYESITSINKERWDSKGIAVVHFEMEGRKGKVKLDDWVFRDADLVLEEVEHQTGLGGPLPA